MNLEYHLIYSSTKITQIEYKHTAYEFAKHQVSEQQLSILSENKIIIEFVLEIK